jgi:hypothetical protein
MFIVRSSRVNPSGGSAMHAESRTEQVTRRANELYWGSEDSVNQIAERLDLSKSALYGLIGPLGSGCGCPICGAEVEFPNRTARERDELTCPECGWDGAEGETVPLDADPMAGPEGSARVREAVAGGDLNRVFIGSLLLGAGTALALFRLLRRR